MLGAFPGVAGQHQFGLPDKGERNVALYGGCYSLSLDTADGTEDRSVPLFFGGRAFWGTFTLRMLA